jgi:ornithine cyclodeaminase
MANMLKDMSKPQCERLLHALEESLKTFSAEDSSPGTAKHIHQPHRTAITSIHNNNTVLFMPSSDTKNAAVKVVTLSSRGAQGVINIFSSDGALLGLLSAGEITAFRTALASLSVLRRCRSLPKDNVVIFGSGRQAEWHARLALLLLPAGTVRTVTFVNRGRKRLEDLARSALEELRSKYPAVNITTLALEDLSASEKLRDTISSSNVIFTCTPSTRPLFPQSYMEANGSRQRFISLIGSYKPQMQEVDTPTLLSGSTIYVESKKACLAESGELIVAGVQESDLVEIGEIFGREKGLTELETTMGPNIIFKSVGMGIMDLAVGKAALDLSSQLGVGVDVTGF